MKRDLSTTLCAIAAFVLCLSHAGTRAQNLETFRQRLAAPVQIDSLHTAYDIVRIEEMGDAAEAISLSSQSMKRSANGYRIVIFMSNAQNARNDAFAARECFDSIHPDQKSYIFYENPYYKVAAGNCLSQEEAIILLERIKRDFPKAFVMREAISPADLVHDSDAK